MTTQESNPTTQVADALRDVALALELALEAGKRSTRIDAEDLRETLLAVADRIDPPHRPASEADARGCEFCRDACNRPDGEFTCPYCHASWQ